jgi:phage terminase large subunit-like protein
MDWVDANTLYSQQGLSKQQLEVRQAAVNNFEAFIRLVAPYQLMAHCHVVMCKWAQEHGNENRLLLWPRDHGKSRYAAFYAAWEVVRDPATTIIYASATAEKAEEQLRFVKSILDNKIVRRYFPDLILPEEGRREAWNKTYIVVDHPYRKSEGVVDSTIMTCGLEKTITGKHCKRLILDDIVVPENNTETGRRDVNAWAAQAASIMSADSSMFVVGTRYHPKDAYQLMMDMAYDDPTENEDGDITISEIPMFQIMMDNVEDDGEFLWPRQQRKDGKYFGFNQTVLAKKRAVYESLGEITQFYAQYYNDPNDKSTAPISRDLFKYYKKEEVEYVAGLWTIQGRPVWMYASVDMATTTKDTSDYTVIVVGAIDEEGNRYVVDITRFKSSKTSEILSSIREAYQKYMFKKLRIEAVGGFRLVAQDLADRLTEMGIRIPIDLYIPPNSDSKFARVNGILEPLYQAGAIYHYRGGNCQVLEDELVSINPLHDDTKDSWAMCVDLMEKPIQRRQGQTNNVVKFHSRFGGVAA